MMSFQTKTWFWARKGTCTVCPPCIRLNGGGVLDCDEIADKHGSGLSFGAAKPALPAFILMGEGFGI